MAVTLASGPPDEGQIAATFHDGGQEVRMPLGEPIEPAKVKVPISGE